MEAALRFAYQALTKKPPESWDFKVVRGLKGIKEGTVNIAGTDVKVAVVNGARRFAEVCEQVKAGKSPYHFIEFMSLGIVYLNVLFNEWNNLFYNSLQNKDLQAFFRLFGRFAILATFFIVVAVYQIYLRQMLQIRWRRWLTERYVGRWLAGQAYYRLRFENGLTDNPDQRISEDIAGFVEQTLSLTLGLLEAVVSLVSFSVILWELSGDITFFNLPIPGSMKKRSGMGKRPKKRLLCGERL